MKLIPAEDITVPGNRQRVEFEEKAMMELASSIRARGLMQAVVVRDNNVLVAGERRLRAIALMRQLFGECLRYEGELVPPGTIPCVNLGELNAIEAMEAELDENTKRRDLTWQELAAATQKLHTLRSAQAVARGEEQTVTQTAVEVTGRGDGAYREGVRRKLIVADYLDDPDVAKAPDLQTAYKLIQRKEEAQQHVVLAEQVGRNYSSAAHTLVHGDCLEWLAAADPEQFDVILTDPPYGMNAEDFGDGAGRFVAITHNYKDDIDSFFKLMHGFALGAARVAKPAAHMYVCCDIDQFHFLKQLLARPENGGWNVFRTPIINFKGTSGRVPLPDHGPRRCYELILYAHRGGRRTTAIYPDVIGTSGDANLGHGAQKPVALYTDLLKRSTRPGDRVLDPFAGTGTIFPAAHELRLFATGVEREAAYYGIALKRLAALDAEPEVAAAT